MFIQFFCLVLFLWIEVVIADLDTAALTVYRNPDFFRHLSDEFNNHLNNFDKDDRSYGTRDEYHSVGDYDSYSPQYSQQYNSEVPNESDHENQENDEEEHQEEEGYNEEAPLNHQDEYRDDEEEEQREYEKQQDTDDEGYKYPGEPKKPNAPGRPKVNVHYDGSPDFHHPPRDLPPAKKPKKNGRGPYGHPRHTTDDIQAKKYTQNYENHNMPFIKGYEDERPRYNQEYENDRYKSEEALLAEIEEKSRRENNERYPPQNNNDVYPRQYPTDYQSEEQQPLPLRIYHQGQKYPIHDEEYYDEGLRLENRRPETHRYPNIEDFRETKKGTREYLKHHKLPPNHEHEDYTPDNRKENKIVISCGMKAKPKPKKKVYLAYKVRPLYYHYKITPVVRPKKVHSVYFAQPYLVKRSSQPRSYEDNSAYVLNSELDDEVQKVKKVKTVEN